MRVRSYVKLKVNNREVIAGNNPSTDKKISIVLTTNLKIMQMTKAISQNLRSGRVHG